MTTSTPAEVPVPRPARTTQVQTPAASTPLAERIVDRITSSRPITAIVSVALALCFMMFFLEGDILYNSFVANQVARGHLDVYTFFSHHYGFRKIDTVMPPLYYLATGLYLKVLSLLHVDPVAWNPKFLFVNVFHSHMGIVLMLGLVLLKLPNLVAVSAGLYGVSRLAKTVDVDRRLMLALWAASPALIVTALMQAQNDVIPAAITVFALVAFQSRRITWMFLLLGVAACFKTYPLILVPVTALLISNRSLLAAARNTVVGFLPFVLVSLPFLGGTYIHRVFGAHDGNSLLGASYTGRLPVHLWVLGYLVVLGAAWMLSRKQVDIYDVALMWFIPLSLIFVVNWWVPQWAVWLLPSVILLAARDRVIAWLWVFANAAIFVDNIFNYPGNMDGAMLEPFYGDRRHPANSHFYNFHLFHIWKHVPYAVLDGAYIVCGAVFLALALRAVQWLWQARDESSFDEWARRLPSLYASALIGPLLLVPYIGTMVVQRLIG